MFPITWIKFFYFKAALKYDNIFKAIALHWLIAVMNLEISPEP